MKKAIAILILLAISASVIAQENTVFGDINSFDIADNVKWINETPERPEDLIGKVYFVAKDKSSTEYFLPISVPYVNEDKPSIKKSIIVKSNKDGAIGFLEYFTISGKKNSVYEFQVVNDEVWSANQRSPDYLKAVTEFRNNPIVSPVFSSDDISDIFMVTGVFKRKIWYREFSEEEKSGSVSYFLKIDGKDYYSSATYEEVVKYGVQLKPIHSSRFKLPSLVFSANQVEEISGKISVRPEVLTGVVNAVANTVSEQKM